jgi:hypothetical protein
MSTVWVGRWGKGVGRRWRPALAGSPASAACRWRGSTGWGLACARHATARVHARRWPCASRKHAVMGPLVW